MDAIDQHFFYPLANSILWHTPDRWIRIYCALILIPLAWSGALLWISLRRRGGRGDRFLLPLTRGEAADLRSLLDRLLAKNPRPVLIDRLARVRDRLGREG